MPKRYIGVMTGTSLDGADAAAVDFAKPLRSDKAPAYCAFPAELREELRTLQSAGSNELARAAKCANSLAGLCALAAQSAMAQSGWGAADVSAIGLHGQTVRHAPEAGYSIQLANAALVAKLTGVDVVSDFRSADIAMGGQGAPLAQVFHRKIFSCGRPRAVVNLGGMANITILDGGLSEPVAFDTGPGCALLDGMARRHLGKAFDLGGKWAAQGQTDRKLLASMLDHPFFRLDPPKSCGSENFSLEWVDAVAGDTQPQDVQATLLELTARTTTSAAAEWAGNGADLVLCGGGTANSALTELISKFAAPAAVLSSAELGFHPSWVEPAAFAYMAWLRIAGMALEATRATGAQASCIAGAHYRAIR